MGLQQLFHLGVAAVASDIQEAVVHLETQRVRAMIEQESNYLDLILAHREVDRRPVFIVTSRERRVFVQKPLDGFEVSRDTSAEQLPYIDSGSGGPEERLICFEFVGLDHDPVLR